MRLIIIITAVLMLPQLGSAQNIADLTFGSEETFDVVTWNVEWFPKNGQITIDSVAVIIEALDADVIAFQEISDTATFRAMVNAIPGIEPYIHNAWHGGLAYAYKTDGLELLEAYEILETEEYWHNLPRSPLVLRVLFDDQEFVLINNHFKCCGNEYLNLDDPEDEETRRYNASTLLKEHIDEFLEGDRVILLGDLNDILIDNPQHNVFQMFIDDDANYSFADMDIAEGPSSAWSYPGWPSHLDHFLVTNEIFFDLSNSGSEVETIFIEDHLSGGFWEYDQNISDHRPIGMRLVVSDQTGITSNLEQPPLIVFPNPATDQVQIELSQPHLGETLRIFDAFGKQAQSINLTGFSSPLSIDVSEFESGLYFLLIGQLSSPLVITR